MSEQLDVETVTADPWTRFDMWADRAHQLMIEAAEIERTRGDNESTAALTDVLDHHAYVAWSLAAASAPRHNINRNGR